MLRYLSLLVVSLPLAVKTEMASNMVGNTACSQNHVYFSILCIEISMLYLTITFPTFRMALPQNP